MAAFVLVAWLTACQHHPTIAYPKVPEAGAVEEAFDCARLDDAILKTEAVRWVMREDGARLLTPTERAARVTTDVASTVAATALCLFCFSPVTLGDDGHRSLDGVDRRLLSLLKLKQAKACPAALSRIAGLTDLQMYDSLAALLASESVKEPPPDFNALLAERTRLLDHLRP
jgi:hypothetical protein